MYPSASLALIAFVIFPAAMANNNITSTKKSSDTSFVDEITFDNDKCDGDPFVIARRSHTNLTKGPGTQCDNIAASKCQSVDQSDELGKGRKVICQSDMDAPFSLDSSQTFLQIDFFDVKDTKCETEANNRQAFLADGKCRKSGLTWSKVTCGGEEGGFVLTCQDDKCEKDCQKLFAVKPDTCSQNGPGDISFKTLCGSLIQKPDASESNTTKSSNSSSNTNSAQSAGLSFSAFAVTLFATLG